MMIRYIEFLIAYKNVSINLYGYTNTVNERMMKLQRKKCENFSKILT